MRWIVHRYWAEAKQEKNTQAETKRKENAKAEAKQEENIDAKVKKIMKKRSSYSVDMYVV